MFTSPLWRRGAKPRYPMLSRSSAAWLPGSALSCWSFSMRDTGRSRYNLASSGLTASLPMRSPPCTQRSCEPMSRRTSVRFGRITLARLRANGPAITRRRPIDRPLSLAQRMESIELFQSPHRRDWLSDPCLIAIGRNRWHGADTIVFRTLLVPAHDLIWISPTSGIL